mgnify:CR=1 FL=1
MNKIDEIALRVAEEQTRLAGEDPTNMWDDETKKFIVDYAHALLAELSKDAAPKAYWHETETGLHCVNTQPPSGQIGWKTIPLFTHPAPVIASEQKPVAWYDGNKFYANEDSASMCCADMDNLKPVFTSLPNTAEIEQVVEAFIMKFKRHVGGDGEFWLHELEDFCEDGKWREYL